METEHTSLRSRFRCFLMLLGFLGLLAWQGWMTLTLFGAEDPWLALTNAEPVISGSHPLHQYHGYLGAQALQRTGRSCCYDPSFQAGYPKTPLFDNGSRFAEVFMFLGAGGFDPAAYKIGLAISCLLVPLVLLMTARGIGLCGWGSVLASALGQIVWWQALTAAALHNGDLNLLVAGLMLAAHASFLIRYHRVPGIVSWLGMALTAALGWFAHPLLFVLIAPLLLIFYVSTGVKHRTIGWHLGLPVAHAAGLILNWYWLTDWISYWWVHAPLPRGSELLHHRTPRTVWEAPFWGQPLDRIVAVTLLMGGTVGALLLHIRKQRTSARILFCGAGGLLLLTVCGVVWDFWGRLGSSRLLIPALWFAVPASAAAVVELNRFAKIVGRSTWMRLGAAVFLVGLALFFSRDRWHDFASQYRRAKPLEIGLGPLQQNVIQTLRERTHPQARILWEDHAGQLSRASWTALLPILTDRDFIGGLDPAGRIAHSHAGFVRRQLAEKPIAAWSDDELTWYCKRYNIGWIVARSPASRQRFAKWTKGALPLVEFGEQLPGRLFQVKRTGHSYALYGGAEVLQAGARRISLANVRPKNGKVVLSFHYQTGLTALPKRVRIEREPDPRDPVSLIRLRVDQPVSRLTLRWEGK